MNRRHLVSLGLSVGLVLCIGNNVNAVYATGVTATNPITGSTTNTNSHGTTTGTFTPSSGFGPTATGNTPRPYSTDNYGGTATNGMNTHPDGTAGYGGPSRNNTDDEYYRSYADGTRRTDYGWLGLLGLVGLAGIRIPKGRFRNS